MPNMDLSYEKLGEYAPSDLDEELYRLLLEETDEWGTSYQVGECVSGCLSSVQYTIGKLFLVTFLQKLITLTYLPTVAKHTSFLCLGILVLIDWIPKSELMFALLGSVSSLMFLVLRRDTPHKGFITTCTCIASILLLQYYFSASDFMAIRGILMVLVMKISSLAFDRGHDAQFEDLLPFFAYLFNPATLIFGPFLSFCAFEKTLQRRPAKEELSSFVIGVILIVIALFLMIYSSCVTVIVPTESNLADYFTAQSFRTSHYFVSFLSQGLLSMSGIQLAVCSPLSVEFPRSLVEVVVAWNMPMHRYLHSYVYQKILPYSAAVSVFASFAISSLLHGFNFQISAVLLSLGFVCYFENRIRNRLSNRFSMCVRARACRKCDHKMRWNCWQTILVNALFLIHAVYQLIYLGAPFDGNGDSEGYDMYHTLSTWRRHRFAAHWIGLVIVVLSFVL